MNGSLGEVAGDAPVTVLDVFSSVRPLPDAVRASLDAVKAGQLAARARNRRETWKARAVVGGVAAAVAIAGLVVWPHLRAGKTARAASAAIAPAPQVHTAESAPSAGIPTPGGLLAAGVAALPAAAPVAASDAVSDEACRDSYQGKRWRAAAAACATAFAAHPADAKLALRVAEAEYARDHLTEARDWAQRTLTLDDKQADALAIIGRAEQRIGHSDAAARAFRRYLVLAPRGWHAGEARSALRGGRASARAVAAPTVTSAAQPRQHDEGAPQPAVTEPAAFAAPATSPPAAP